jgi:hypothetical protein
MIVRCSGALIAPSGLSRYFFVRFGARRDRYGLAAT